MLGLRMQMLCVLLTCAVAVGAGTVYAEVVDPLILGAVAVTGLVVSAVAVGSVLYG